MTQETLPIDPGCTVRTCKDCGKQEPDVGFSRTLARCNRCRHLAYKAKNPEAISMSWRKGHLKKTYGITLEDEQRMLTEQGWKCKICATALNEVARLRHIDHCHTTGRVRGILCPGCNQMLGRAKDSVEMLRSAIAYLESAEGV